MAQSTSASLDVTAKSGDKRLLASPTIVQAPAGDYLVGLNYPRKNYCLDAHLPPLHRNLLKAEELFTKFLSQVVTAAQTPLLSSSGPSCGPIVKQRDLPLAYNDSHTPICQRLRPSGPAITTEQTKKAASHLREARHNVKFKHSREPRVSSIGYPLRYVPSLPARR
jgi:hypothetical protein